MFFHINKRLVSRVRRVSSVSRKASLFFYQISLVSRDYSETVDLVRRVRRVKSGTRRATFFYKINIGLYESSE